MFDTTIIEETNHPDTINIHHHKAPTDESIKLLNEFQDKALANIVNHIKVESNLVKGDVILYKDKFFYRSKLILKFNLNGKDFVFTEELQDCDFHFDAKIASRKLVEKFSQTLIELILVTGVNDFTRYTVPKLLEQLK